MTGAHVPEGETAGPLRWGACLLLVLGLHAGVAAALLRRAPRPEPPVAALDAVMLELAPAPAPPDAPLQPVAPVPPDPQPEPPMPTPAEPPPVEPPPDVTPPPPEPATPLPQPPPPSPVEALPTPPPPPPAPKRPPPMRPARPPPRPAPEAPASPAAAAAPAPPSALPAAAPSPSALAGWRSELSSRLQRAKRYPDAALARGEQGAATVRFTIDRDGHVLSASLARSSGSDALDEEAVALVHRADPLPPMPPEQPGSTLTLTVPVSFALR